MAPDGSHPVGPKFRLPTWGAAIVKLRLASKTGTRTWAS